MAEKNIKKEKKTLGIVRWYNETMGELRRVTWPTPKETQRLTIIVLIVVFIMSVYFGLLDFIFALIIGKLLT